VAAIEVAAAAAASQEQQQQRQRQQQGRLVVSDTGMRRRVPPSATTAYMTQSVMPQHANTLGITFGGQVRLQIGGQIRWLLELGGSLMHLWFPTLAGWCSWDACRQWLEQCPTSAVCLHTCPASV
jgi:hypothetical protein